MNDGDPFDTGIPKYSTATDIYDALCELTQSEEIGIISEMFSDVSYEEQDYYYTDKGAALRERFEELSDYGDKMWLIDVAVWQLTDEDANDWMYQILCNDDLAKRIGFKKLFVDKVLGCMSSQYVKAAEAFTEELQELDRNDFYANSKALEAALTSIGFSVYNNPYSKLCSAVYDKLKGLRLDAERQLIVECRALLTSYDDFMLGLRMNQALYTNLENQYQSKVAQLKAGYEVMVRQLIQAAAGQGITFEPIEALKKLSE